MSLAHNIGPNINYIFNKCMLSEPSCLPMSALLPCKLLSPESVPLVLPRTLCIEQCHLFSLHVSNHPADCFQIELPIQLGLVISLTGI